MRRHGVFLITLAVCDHLSCCGVGALPSGAAGTVMLPDVIKLVNGGAAILSCSASHVQLSAAVLIRLGQPADTIPGLATEEQYPTPTKDLALRRATAVDACPF